MEIFHSIAVFMGWWALGSIASSYLISFMTRYVFKGIGEAPFLRVIMVLSSLGVGVFLYMAFADESPAMKVFMILIAGLTVTIAWLLGLFKNENV